MEAQILDGLFFNLKLCSIVIESKDIQIFQLYKGHNKNSWWIDESYDL